MVDFVNPDGTPTDPDWFSDVGDSAPQPDDGDDVPDIPEDSVGVSDPDGSDPDPDWTGDVGDSAPDLDAPADAPGVIGVIPDGGNDGLLAGVGVGVLGLLVGVAAVVMGGED
jgi:hypothetical protein